VIVIWEEREQRGFEGHRECEGPQRNIARLIRTP
jgi:hypothetical protein